jgi:hypothetical protein
MRSREKGVCTFCGRFAYGALLGFAVLTAGCGSSGKKGVASDAASWPDGPQAAGGTTATQSGGATSATSGTGGMGASGGTGGRSTVDGTGGAATGGTTSGTGGTDVSGGGRGGSALGGSGGAASGGTPGGGGTRTGGTGTGCCGSDAPCPQGYSCAGSIDQLNSRLGRCEPTPPSGSCWNDIDCPQDGLCRSAVTCACDAECFAANQPGTCQAAGELCCRVYEDCTDGKHCVGAYVFTKGRCLAAPSDTRCYTNGDCPTGRFCYNATICPCGTNCPSQSGFCAIE